MPATSLTAARVLPVLPLKQDQPDHPLFLYPADPVVSAGCLVVEMERGLQEGEHEHGWDGASTLLQQITNPRSALLMLAHVSLPLGFKTFDLAPGLTVSPSLATVIAVGYAAYYVSMDIFVGVSTQSLRSSLAD